MDLYVLKEKFRNMNLKFKSSEPDLKFNIQSQFRIINQNILYLTRETDDIKRILTRMTVNDNAQKQVDDFYETSPQTDIDDKEPD